MVAKIVDEIKIQLKNSAPSLTEAQKERMYKILNSSNPNFVAYGLKLSDTEKITRAIFKNNECSYKDAVKIFKQLISSDIHDEKFAGVFFLNRTKKEFDEATINLFHEVLSKYNDTWALVDSTCIRVLGPFLAKNEDLAKRVIGSWSTDENFWIRRASMVILLKIIMMKKDFDEDYLFNLVEKMVEYPEDYIHKGAGWLLCPKCDMAMRITTRKGRRYHVCRYCGHRKEVTSGKLGLPLEKNDRPSTIEITRGELEG